MFMKSELWPLCNLCHRQAGSYFWSLEEKESKAARARNSNRHLATQVKIAEGYQDFNVSLVTIFLIKHQQVMSTFLRSLD